MNLRSWLLFWSAAIFGFLVANMLNRREVLRQPHRFLQSVSNLSNAKGDPPTIELSSFDEMEISSKALFDDVVENPPPLLKEVVDRNSVKTKPPPAPPAVKKARANPAEDDRHLWDNISMTAIYPPINDVTATFRPLNETLKALGICPSNGGPINWKLNENFEVVAHPSNHSSLRFSARPDPPRKPYRGHVKACMHENYGYFWQEYWKLYGECKGNEYCDLPCGDVHCRFVWNNFHDCTAAIMHHQLESIAGDAPYLRKIVSITEPYYKPEVVAILNDHRREDRRSVDIIAHWHRTANIFYPAHNNQFSPGGEEEFAKKPNFAVMACPPRTEVLTKTSVERRIGLVVFNNGNCATAGNYRENYVRELRQYIHVDAYGPCLKSKERPPIPPGDHWRYEYEIEVRSHYKFFLAFENQISEDWVTERVFSGLAAGTVPIYYGAKNVEDFLPCTSCIIQARKFSGPQELAKYLIFLDQNPDKYMEYHLWRDQPLRIPPALLTSKAFWYCGACQAVADDIEGKLVHVQWDGANEQWVPDPGRPRKPVPPTWANGFD